ncbi:MAG: phytanoyl-CoA dioxygenase family protein, partial [Anaerolineae bacterium]|nr:phytanoyl-CoA dioxygenase family protein [Anaerolineae bacterium]
MPEPTITLTPDQIDFFHQKGYLVIESISSPEEIEWMRGVYDRLFANKTGREEGNQFDLAGADDESEEARLPQILGPARYAPELKDTLYHANALAITQQLLGAEARFLGDHAILKPPYIGAATPWHQDEAYWDGGMLHHSLSAWMPLQDVGVENGCMQFIPSQMDIDVRPHHSINHDPRVHGLEIDEIDTAQAVICPLKAGGATFHYCRTPHYTGPNLSGEPRRAYILGLGVLPE